MKALRPNTIHYVIAQTAKFLGNLQYLGKGRLCETCGASSSKFKPFGDPPRPDAQCRQCSSLERHRFLCHYLNVNPDHLRFGGGKFLHVAPEACLRTFFGQLVGRGYLTADMFADNVDVKMDISDIQFPDQYFDAIYCSHVLEHVPDDRRAMREFARVLKPDGWAILLVPISREKTYEDPSIQTPEARRMAFGQADHVRIYGNDYVDRLAESGFKVKRICLEDFLSPQKIKTYGLGSASGDIFLCQKN
jgi:SAM-dependent methyltransferase